MSLSTVSSPGLDAVTDVGSAILIGSGPSLNRIDMSSVAGYRSIAFNRSWLAWRDWGFQPTFHACLDPATVAVIGPELPEIVANCPETHFFLHEHASSHGVPRANNVTFCRLLPGDSFGATPTTLTDFGNVGAVSVQLLQILGFRRILMLGVDGHYAPDSGSARDLNHFRDDYARGRVPLTPALRARYLDGWLSVAAECSRLGVSVRNASPGTALACFERIDIESGLIWLSQPQNGCEPVTHLGDHAHDQH